MKKIKAISLVLALALSLSLVLSLTGCHGREDFAPFVMPDEFDTSKEYNIVFWAKNEKNIKQTKVYQKAIEDFEKLYPNINVTMKLYSDYKVIYRDVITNIPTQTTPNVCITYPDHIATYMTGKNIVLPLDELLTDSKYGLGGAKINFDAPTKEEIIPKFLGEGVIDGIQYALPFMRSTEALYYNKTYVEALGFEIPEVITWEFIWEVSNAALEKNEDGTYVLNGQKKMIPFVYKSTDNMMIQMLKQRGADYANENGDILIFNDDTRDILYTVRDNTDTGAFSTFGEASYPADLLNRGQCIFAIDSTAGSVWMGREGPLSAVDLDEAIEYELAVSQIPQVSEDSEPAMISQGPSICIFNKADSQEVLASWIFAQFLLTNSVQIAYSQTEGYVPVTSKAQESEEYLDYLSRAGELDANGDNYLYYAPKIQATKILLENTENTFITPVFNGSASLRMAAGEMIELVVDAMIAKPQKTVDDAFIDKLYSDVESLYHLNGIGFGEATVDEGLPTFSVALLISLGAVWLVLIGFFLWSIAKKQSKKVKKEKLS
jgi:multiple sugar transport system substrate-binding protein